MNKSTILLLLALIACSLCLKVEHEQRYGPSTPGGTSTNYTQPYSQPNNYYNSYSQPKPSYNNYNQYSQPQPGYNTYSNTNSYNQPTPLINGQPYVYRGPFVLACWSRYNNQQPLYRNSCYDSNGCYNLLVSYQKCSNDGNIVKKYQQ